ncbi:hypothetical protein E3N88_13506 [Mikania micrantha]|uniref:Uncharacterized protein n=1 Tax=Mikania micrantha TaxID=192012 RepID=A0A5N6PB23_9ASTR|nr:hypothetical protein E3N88_13506 [Mikania micrantha]
MSPVSSIGQNSVNELASSVRNMQLGNGTRLSANSVSGAGFCSPRNLSTLRPGYTSLPFTPTRSGGNIFDQWDHGFTREEPVMERVESGKEIREKILVVDINRNVVHKVYEDTYDQQMKVEASPEQSPSPAASNFSLYKPFLGV